MLGTMTFDGAGNVAGSYSIGGTRGANGGSFTGNYSVAGSGSGTINLQLDTGVSVTVAAAANTGGAGMQMLFTGGMTGLYGIALRQ